MKSPLLAFERLHEPLVPRRVFLWRLVWSGLVALGLILVSLSIGIAGYHWIAGFKWVDALLNASMILGGMGPVDVLPNDAAKVFASAYALFSGFTFLSSVGVFLSPALHRLVHHFHLEAESSGSDKTGKG